ncbi:SRPBCC domain-containing protein [Prolixibacter sp. NT017]|uniref:SRPBCC domain-containing protein n=1 Tax=Prolixibacter sp. NT017 TaxID=2652390 RepID=UPI001270C141|nr:SRPBCC domain-containing protein [Prolixibacter sp. NT017]GET24283.1 activator of HSP90 ATPase [Prolixibacter sp. NT017]
MMEDLSQRSLSVTRMFNAPINLLWQVLTTADYIKDWWGPDGFTNTIRIMEVSEGGKWEFTMHGPDGTDYENVFIYREIVPLKKIVMDHLADPKFTISIRLFDEGEQTRMEWQNTFETVADFKLAVDTFKADEGLKQNIERLAAYINTLTQ